MLTKSDGLNTKLNAWENELNNSKLTNENSDVKKQSQFVHDSDNTEQGGDKEFRDNVTEQRVLSMKTRFENIETLLNNILDYIDGVKYNGKKLRILIHITHLEVHLRL